MGDFFSLVDQREQELLERRSRLQDELADLQLQIEAISAFKEVMAKKGVVSGQGEVLPHSEPSPVETGREIRPAPAGRLTKMIEDVLRHGPATVPEITALISDVRGQPQSSKSVSSLLAKMKRSGAAVCGDGYRWSLIDGPGPATR